MHHQCTSQLSNQTIILYFNIQITEKYSIQRNAPPVHVLSSALIYLQLQATGRQNKETAVESSAQQLFELVAISVKCVLHTLNFWNNQNKECICVCSCICTSPPAGGKFIFSCNCICICDSILVCVSFVFEFEQVQCLEQSSKPTLSSRLRSAVAIY